MPVLIFIHKSAAIRMICWGEMWRGCGRKRDKEGYGRVRVAESEEMQRDESEILGKKQRRWGDDIWEEEKETCQTSHSFDVLGRWCSRKCQIMETVGKLNRSLQLCSHLYVHTHTHTFSTPLPKLLGRCVKCNLKTECNDLQWLNWENAAYQQKY